MPTAIPSVEAIATISSKGQFTLPKPLRDALGLVEGAKVRCLQDGDGLRIEKFEEDGADPALTAFLGLIEKDIAEERALAPLPSSLEARLRAAAAGIEADDDAPIEGDVAL